VRVVDRDPGRVLVRRVQGVGRYGRLVLQLATFYAGGAGLQIVVIQAGCVGAFLFVRVSRFRALDAADVGFVFLGRFQSIDAATLQLIDDAFLVPVLAREGIVVRVGRILSILSVSVREDGQVDVIGQLSVHGVQLVAEELQAARALAFGVDADFHDVLRGIIRSTAHGVAVANVKQRCADEERNQS
jgi:hypothetical protein